MGKSGFAFLIQTQVRVVSRRLQEGFQSSIELTAITWPLEWGEKVKPGLSIFSDSPADFGGGQAGVVELCVQVYSTEKEGRLG